jgi:hypothetical protein
MKIYQAPWSEILIVISSLTLVLCVANVVVFRSLLVAELENPNAATGGSRYR